MDTSIQNNLLPNEEILWEGRPHISDNFNFSNIAKSMFGLIWLGFSLFWTITAFLMTRAISTSDSTAMFFKYFFPLFGLPFVAIGVFIVFVAPRKEKMKALNTCYYITDKRLIINIDTSSGTFRSALIKNTDGIQITRNRDNTGNIMFSPSFNTGINKTNISSVNVPAYNNCFYRIESADEVYKLILLRREIVSLEKDNTITE